MPRTVLFLLAAVSLGFAPAPFLKSTSQAAAEADLKALQGEWGLQDYLHCGKRGLVPAVICRYAGDVLTATRRGGPVMARYKISLGVANSRKTMTMVVTYCWYGPKGGQPVRSLYRLEGDTLTVCTRLSGGGLPESLEPNEEVDIEVYKRNRP